MITTVLNSKRKIKGLLVKLQKNHPEYFTLILTKNRNENKEYNIFINESLFTIDACEFNETASCKIETRYLKDGQNQIKIIAKDSYGVETVFYESFYYSSPLKLRKVATGVTFDVFQWKRPQDSNNHYKIIFNGKEFSKVSESTHVLETIYISNYINGKNTIEVIAYTLNGTKNYIEQFNFEYPLVDRAN